MVHMYLRYASSNYKRLIWIKQMVPDNNFLYNFLNKTFISEHYLDENPFVDKVYKKTRGIILSETDILS